MQEAGPDERGGLSAEQTAAPRGGRRALRNHSGQHSGRDMWGDLNSDQYLLPSLPHTCTHTYLSLSLSAFAAFEVPGSLSWSALTSLSTIPHCVCVFVHTGGIALYKCTLSIIIIVVFSISRLSLCAVFLYHSYVQVSGSCS